MCAVPQAGSARIDLSRYELTLDGRRVKLERQPMELLIFFAERKGQLVTRDDIVEKLWGKDVFVDVDRSINAAVRKIRSALKDNPDQPKYLETIVGKGYRLTGEIELATGLPARPGKPSEAAETEPVRRRWAWRGWAAWVVSAASVVLIAVATWSWRHWRQGTVAPQAQIHSLVVLPLANLSGDSSQDYFAEGMTDELITELAKIGKLRVISRTSAMQYRGSKKPLREIAKELNVDAVLEGSVQRSGDRVRVTAQLIRAADDTNLWAESYDRDLRDVLALESEVARSIAKRIQAELTPEEQARLAAPVQVDPEAYQLYVRGLYYLHQGRMEGATASQKYFQQAIEKDPKFARAYVGLALSHDLNRDFQLAKEPARKAVELDPSLSSAHTALAYTAYRGDWDFATAAKEFQRALDLSPFDSWALGLHAAYLESLGRNEEAIAEMRRSLEVDPLSPLSNTNLGFIYGDAGRYSEAILQAKTALEIDPNYTYAHLALGLMYEQQGQYEDAAAEYRDAGNEVGEFTGPLLMAHLYAAEGRRAEALRLLGQVRPTKDDLLYGVPYVEAMVYARLGDKDQAFKWLEEAFRKHDPDVLDMKLEPDFKPLHSDPRFQDLLRRVGLPQ
jgi:TolB-like protein/DNA-binding winged helix-turn-helix (wHTH) protein/Tfp pilus assembly protein PilF